MFHKLPQGKKEKNQSTECKQDIKLQHFRLTEYNLGESGLFPPKPAYWFTKHQISGLAPESPPIFQNASLQPELRQTVGPSSRRSSPSPQCPIEARFCISAIALVMGLGERVVLCLAATKRYPPVQSAFRRGFHGSHPSCCFSCAKVPQSRQWWCMGRRRVMTLTALSREPLINPRIVLLEMTAQIGVPRMRRLPQV